MIIDDIKDGWNQLRESLSRPFYSSREAMLDQHKNSSQVAKEVDLENSYVAYDPFNSYNNSYLLQGNASSVNNFNDLVRKWRETSQLPEVDGAITEISSEAIVYDEIEDVITLNLDDIDLSENIKTKMMESFKKILFLLDFNERGDDLFRQWYVDAILTFEVVYNNRKIKSGIEKLILLPPFDIAKFKNESNGEVRWYINKHMTYNISKDLEDAEKTYFDEQITQINSGVLSTDKKLYFSPLQKAMKVINQLYMLEDSMIIFRITKSPEKRVFYIDTGNLPKAKAEEYMKSLISRYRQKKIYNTETGTIENSNKSISVLEDFWFPVNAQGKGTKVENLPGVSTNFSSFDDIEYFLNKAYMSLNVPNNRRNKDSRVTINANIDIEQEELRFFKYIQKLRRRFNNLFVDLLKKDLIAKQVLSLADWIKIQEKIKFVYADSNELSTIKKTQILVTKMEAANTAMGLIEPKIMSPQYIQKNILRLTDEEIKEIANDFNNGGSGGENDALGNMGGGSQTPPGMDTGEIPGYEEVGMGDEPNANGKPNKPETSEVEETPGKRFSQK